MLRFPSITLLSKLRNCAFRAFTLFHVWSIELIHATELGIKWTTNGLQKRLKDFLAKALSNTQAENRAEPTLPTLKRLLSFTVPSF